MDYIFCNPPYSEFESWTLKILEECNCKALYMIIPERWKENENIQRQVKRRCEVNFRDYKSFEILGSFDFNHSEYRQARAKIDIVKFNFHKKEDSFDYWFNNNFKVFEQKIVDDSVEETKNQLVVGKNLIERIETLYQYELNKLLNSYKSFESISSELLAELGVNKESIKDGLKQKISSLKNKYWKELFDNLDKITNRLTSKYRKKILDKMFDNVTIDVTCDNMYSIIIWIIKNANIYQDEQLKDIYFSMTEQKNIILYKSNKHFVADTWRYGFKNKVSKYKLDYRIVIEGSSPSTYSFENKNGLSSFNFDFIKDILTVGKIFEFKLNNCDIDSIHFETGKSVLIYDDGGEIFAEFRPYKNGNIHIKFNKSFIMKLNIEVGKLNGWIKDPQHCAEEMEIDEKEVLKFYDNNVKIEFKNINNLIEYKE